jgi:hypothetical protein
MVGFKDFRKISYKMWSQLFQFISFIQIVHNFDKRVLLNKLIIKKK